MKHYLFISICGSLISLQSCKSNTSTSTSVEDKNLIPVSAINNPRTENGATLEINNLGKLVFTDTVHDFGNLKEGDVVEYDFEYINAGKSDLLINEAKSTCGCTVPDFKREPIPSGEKGIMKVKFNSTGKHDAVDKAVNIITNGNPSEMRIRITAIVNSK
jgi:hypothetical protein